MTDNYCSEDYIRFRESEVYIIMQSLAKLLKGFDFGLEISPDFDWYFIDGKTQSRFKVSLSNVRQILNEVEYDTNNVK